MLPQQLSESPEYEPMVWWPERIDPDACMPGSRSRRKSNSSTFVPKGYCDHSIKDGVVMLYAVRVDISTPVLARQLAPHAAAMPRTFADTDADTIEDFSDIGELL